MLELIEFFIGKSNFNNESFYYYFPYFNPDKKKIIGEKIIKYKGVNIYILVIE